jgi:hypothetical protein
LENNPIELARRTMRDIKVALTRGTDGEFPVDYYDWWESMNMPPPNLAWQDMDVGQRYDLLVHALDESIWSLVPSDKSEEPRDSQRLALEFVNDDERRPWPSDIAEANRHKQPDKDRGNENGKDAGYSM